jgi:hypothetical protein
MAKTKISEYSSTSADNTDISNINIAEGCSPANVNNAIRTLMAQIKNLQAGTSGDTIPVTAGGTGSTTASAARTALSAAATGANSDITSLTACTSITGLTTPLSVAQGGTGVQVTRTISSVSLTSNVVTITTSAAHGYLANDSVTVTATTQTTVNGTYTIISVPTSTTFTYAKTASNISPIADTGSVVSSSNIKMSAASGTLSVSNGGTGVSTLKANNLLVGNGTSSPSVIPAGTTGNVLTSSTASTVTAGSFAVGTEYTILTVGTTDYTLIGAASNTVGVVFTATGVGTGDGTATTNTWVSSAPAQNGLGQGQTWQDVLSSRNATVVTAGSFVIGNIYTIVAVGTTNFTLIGASANTVGVVFTATGAGSGTGTARNTYKNTTGKPIVVNVVSDQGSGGSATLTATISGVSFIIATESNSGGGTRSAGNVIVPDNATYMIVASGTGVSGFLSWHELR